jgi:hypothetical protein
VYIGEVGDEFGGVDGVARSGECAAGSVAGVTRDDSPFGLPELI